MNKPLVSVVIPVYNVEDFITQCLDSVVNQSYQHLDIVLVDDGGPDNSVNIIRAYMEEHRDPRIRLVSQANRGLAGARNTGIRQAKGELIAFLDSDDFWAADKIEKHVELMQTNPDCGISFSASMFVDENGASLNRLQQPLDKINFSSANIFCRNPIGNGSVPVIRKSIFEQLAFHTEGTDHAQYFDESLRQSEDIDCWIRISLLTQTNFAYIDEPLTYYRLNSGGLSANVDKQFETWEQVYNKVALLSPTFIDRYGQLARAYQFRYLARRLILESNAKKACALMWRALTTSPAILIHEPKRTLSTMLASAGLLLMPAWAREKLVAALI